MSLLGGRDVSHRGGTSHHFRAEQAALQQQGGIYRSEEHQERGGVHEAHTRVGAEAIAAQMRSDQQLPSAAAEHSAHSGDACALPDAHAAVLGQPSGVHAEYHLVESVHTEHRQAAALSDDLSAACPLGCDHGAVDRTDLQGSTC